MQKEEPKRDSLIIGFHTERKVDGKRTGIVAAMQNDIKTMREYTATPCLQIFTSGPRGFKHITTAAERAEIAKMGIPVVIHGNYMDRPWGGAAAPVASVRSELLHAQECGATGVIVHLSAAAHDDEKLRTALHGIGAHAGVVLWLEIHTAKMSPQTYETPAKIATLFERVRRLGVAGQVYGLCIDTAHLWACGKSLATREVAAEWLREVEAGIGQHPIMMHLNDSKKEFGGGVDQHDSLCQGNIWREYHPVNGSKPFADSGLAYIFEWLREHRTVTILERDMADLHYDFEILRHEARLV